MQNNEVDLNRRKLFIFTTCFVGIASIPAVSIGKNTFQTKAKNLSKIDKIRRELFKVDQINISLLPAADNPNVDLKDQCSEEKGREKYTTTTHNAAKHFASVFHDVSENNVKTLYAITNSNFKGNLITFGSPSSNLITRITMGYHKIGAKGEGFSHAPKPGLNLAVRYELDAERIKSARGVKYRTLERSINGKVITLANWGIRLKNGIIRCPKVIENNLAEDFLIVSSLPNTFNKEALLNDQRIINFGGTHRAGTQAINIMLDSGRFLQELHRRIKKIQGDKLKQPYWQALIAIRGVNSKNRSSEPLSLGEILLVEEVEINKPKLINSISGNVKQLKSQLNNRVCG